MGDGRRQDRVETQLGTHDVAVSLSSQRSFRAIFMSPQDAISAESLIRIERLYSINGGRESGIVFLLKQGEDQESGVSALMKFQLRLVGNWALPIIPVESVAAVPATLATIQQKLNPLLANRKAAEPSSNLLPSCSDGKPLEDHSVNVITDLTAGFGDLLDKLASNAVFEATLTDLIGEDADRLKRFWAYDCPVY